jgi:hypothetical protein
MIFQLKLATLIRVRNLFQTATAYREKLHRWDFTASSSMTKIIYENIKFKTKCEAGHPFNLNYTIKSNINRPSKSHETIPLSGV